MIPIYVCAHSIWLLSIYIFGFQLWKRFRGEDKPPEPLGASRDYNVDMIPKAYISQHCS